MVQSWHRILILKAIHNGVFAINERKNTKMYEQMHDMYK